MNLRLSKDKRKYTADCAKVMGHYKIKSPEETLDELINTNKSITRLGDGEFDMIYKIGMNYQKYDEKLAQRLKEIVQNDDEGIIVGIPNVFNLEYCDEYTGFATEFWPKWVNKFKFRLVNVLKRNKQFYSAQITRFYLDYKDKSTKADYVKKLKQVWDGKDVVIIEGEHSRLGVGNDLFDNMKSIERIICPSENAFEIYDKIYNEVLKVDKNKLILLALGPTATVLAYDLYKAGYRTIDIGHVDIEYEWFLMKATTKVKVKHKYVTEVKEGRVDIEDVNDSKYQSEIIARVL